MPRHSLAVVAAFSISPIAVAQREPPSKDAVPPAAPDAPAPAEIIPIPPPPASEPGAVLLPDLGVLGGISLRGLEIVGVARGRGPWSAGVLYGGLPKITAPDWMEFEIDTRGNRLEELSFDYTRYEIWGAWHPWRGAAYTGLGLERRISKTAVGVVAGGNEKLPARFDLTLDTWFLSPKFGWLWTFGPGFSLGTELSFRYSASSKASLDARGAYIDRYRGTREYVLLKEGVTASVEKFLGGSKLHWAMLRLGWIF